MDVREKLVEILRKPIFPHELADPIEAVADYLLDNGVTVQQWIPVSERLPTEDDANEDGEILAVWVGGKVMNPIPAICGGTCSQFWGYVVQNTTWFSHWMPMPKPPKGE